MKKDTVIIVAGGSGCRMGSDLPKQFLPLDGLPVIFHSINAFLEYDPDIEIVIGISVQYHDYWKELCVKHSFNKDHIVSEGGKTRFETVKYALALITGDDGVVAVHDAARPLVSKRTIEESFITAREKGNAVPSVPVSDSFRMWDGTISRTIDRKSLRAIQTPQVFRKSLLKKAYDTASGCDFTDDASVLEATGETIILTNGNPENIKITTPADLIFVESLSTRRK